MVIMADDSGTRVVETLDCILTNSRPAKEIPDHLRMGKEKLVAVVVICHGVDLGAFVNRIQTCDRGRQRPKRLSECR